MSGAGFVGMLAHLRYRHKWTWKQLRAVFPGYGSHVWESVRWTVADMEAEGVEPQCGGWRMSCHVCGQEGGYHSYLCTLASSQGVEP